MWYQMTQAFTATPETVYDTLWKAPKKDHAKVETNVLEQMTITGTPGQIGHVQQLRIIYGPLDLFLIETVRIADRPYCYEVQQLPDGLQRHNPDERDIPFLNSMVEDLDAKFHADFGNQPLATHIRVDLAAAEHGCDATLTLSVPNAEPLGVFGLWRWKKFAKKQLATVQKQIAAAL